MGCCKSTEYENPYFPKNAGIPPLVPEPIIYTNIMAESYYNLHIPTKIIATEDSDHKWGIIRI
jgi:hypothetical protein